MKKATLSRILGLALALVLALSTSVAFALPSGTSAIEGLPEMPTVPTMTTSAKGYDVTVTLSEPLATIVAMQNWQELPITMSDDGLTGAYNTKELSSQPGYGTWKNGWGYFWTAPQWEGWEAWREFYVNKQGHSQTTVSETPIRYGTGYLFTYPGDVWEGEEEYIVVPYQTYVEAEEELDEEAIEDLYVAIVTDAQDWLIEEYPEAAEQIVEVGEVSDYMESCLGYKHTYYEQDFGTYDMGGPGFYKDPNDNGPGSKWSLGYAYKGATNDGTNVYYGRFGEVVQISKDLTGVNFLGTDKTPVKTTVTWIPLNHKGKSASNYYINQITEEYEDGSKLTAHFSSSMGGKLLGTKAE